MIATRLGAFFVAATIVTFPSLGTAQNPTPAQAQQMLQNNPALLQQLRQKIMTSGLTPDQVRARLRAEGYPENLLDAYLSGGNGTADTTATSADVFSAIAQLGIADTTEIDLIRCGINTDTLAVTDTLASGLVDTVQNRRRLAIRREQARQACLAQQDSTNRGLNTARINADSGFTIFGLDFFR